MQIILSQLAKDLAGDTRLTNRSDAWLKGLDDAFTGRGYTPPCLCDWSREHSDYHSGYLFASRRLVQIQAEQSGKKIKPAMTVWPTDRPTLTPPINGVSFAQANISKRDEDGRFERGHAMVIYYNTTPRGGV